MLCTENRICGVGVNDKQLASKWKDSLDQRAYKALMKWEVSGAA